MSHIKRIVREKFKRKLSVEIANFQHLIKLLLLIVHIYSNFIWPNKLRKSNYPQHLYKSYITFNLYISNF